MLTILKEIQDICSTNNDIKISIDKYKEIQSLDNEKVRKIISIEEENDEMKIKQVVKVENQKVDKYKNIEQSIEEVKFEEESSTLIGNLEIKSGNRFKNQKIFINKSFDKKIYLALHLLPLALNEPLSSYNSEKIIIITKIILIFFNHLIHADYDDHIEGILRFITKKTIHEAIFNEFMQYKEKLEVVYILKSFTSKIRINDLNIERKFSSAFKLLYDMIFEMNEVENYIKEKCIKYPKNCMKKLKDILNKYIWSTAFNFKLQFINYFTRIFKRLDFSEKIKEDILNYLRQAHLNSRIPNSFQLICEIDKILPNYDNPEMVKSQVKLNANSLLRKYSQDFLKAEKNYYKMVLSENYPIEELLHMFCYKFLEILKSEKCDLLFDKFNRYSLIQDFVCFTNIIDFITSKPPEVVYSFLEICQTIDSYKGDLIDYLFDSQLFFKQHKFLSEELKIKFLRRTLSFPFREVFLQAFWPKERCYSEFEDTIKNFINHTIIMDLPVPISGISIHNRFLCIGEYKVKECFPGSTFYVFLHECAHKLQRINCVTYSESHQPLSECLLILIDPTILRSELEKNIEKNIKENKKNSSDPKTLKNLQCKEIEMESITFNEECDLLIHTSTQEDLLIKKKSEIFGVNLEKEIKEDFKGEKQDFLDIDNCEANQKNEILNEENELKLNFLTESLENIETNEKNVELFPKIRSLEKELKTDQVETIEKQLELKMNKLDQQNLSESQLNFEEIEKKTNLNSIPVPTLEKITNFASPETKSTSNKNLKKRVEGGNVFESFVYGSTFRIITQEAAEYLFEEIGDITINKFRETFQQKNSSEKIISLPSQHLKGVNCQFLGLRCGTHYSRLSIEKKFD